MYKCVLSVSWTSCLIPTILIRPTWIYLDTQCIQSAPKGSQFCPQVRNLSLSEGTQQQTFARDLKICMNVKVSMCFKGKQLQRWGLSLFELWRTKSRGTLAWRTFMIWWFRGECFSIILRCKVQESTQKWTLVPSVAMSGWMDWAGKGRMEGEWWWVANISCFGFFKFSFLFGKENGWNHNTKLLYPNQELVS